MGNRPRPSPPEPKRDILNAGLLDSAGSFATPADVVADPDLSVREKIEILRRWRYDASGIGTAQGEDMADGDGSGLDQVLAALSRLLHGPGAGGSDD